jgi:hypothetical protein
MGIFLFMTVSRPVLGPTQAPIQWVPGALSLGAKQPGREAYNSPPYSTEAKEWVELYLYSPDTPSWRGAQWKHRSNFTFTLLILYFGKFSWRQEVLNWIRSISWVWVPIQELWRTVVTAPIRLMPLLPTSSHMNPLPVCFVCLSVLLKETSSHTLLHHASNFYYIILTTIIIIRFNPVLGWQKRSLATAAF